MTTRKYSRFRPDPFEDLDLSDLLDELSDYFLDSGFDMYRFSELSERMFLEWARDVIPEEHRDRIVTLHLRGRMALPFWHPEVRERLAGWL